MLRGTYGQTLLDAYLKSSVAWWGANAKVMWQAYQQATDIAERKRCAVNLFEQRMLATESVVLVYTALRKVTTRPIVKTLFHTTVDDKVEQNMANDLDTNTNAQVLALLGLGPTLNYTAPTFSPAETRQALQEAVDELRDVLDERTANERRLVQVLNKIKHGYLVVDRPDFLPQGLAPADYITIVGLNVKNAGKQVIYYQLPVTTAAIDESLEVIERMEGAVSTILGIYLAAENPI